jgi:membrane associated rhomboid family serine protease
MAKKEEKEITVLNSIKVGVVLLLIMWSVFLYEIVTGTSLSNWGILPRVKSGLWGVLFSPFLHGSWEHLINNSPPIFILSATLFYFYRKIAWEILLLSWIIGGLCIWAAARNGDHFSIYHIGMSGVIYSLAFFVFFSGVFRKEAKLLAIALFVVFLYGSMVWGLLPMQEGVSFEAHIFGAVVGIALAYIYRKSGATFQKKKYQYEIDEENDAKMKSQGYHKLLDENGFTVRYVHKDDMWKEGLLDPDKTSMT